MSVATPPGWEEVDEAISVCNHCRNDDVEVRRGLLFTPCGHTICEGCARRSKQERECSGCTNEGLAATRFRKDELVPINGRDPVVQQELKERAFVLKCYARPESTFTDVEGGEPASVQVSGL